MPPLSRRRYAAGDEATMPSNRPRKSGADRKRAGSGDGAWGAGWSLPSTGRVLPVRTLVSQPRSALGFTERGFRSTVTETVSETVVVGLGNELARDDGVGIHVARRLAALLEGRRDVEVVLLPWAGFALLDALVGRKRAVVVDCLVSATQSPGRITRLSEMDFRGSVRLNSFHDINYPTALFLGRQMGWPIPTEIAIWAIEGDAVDEFGEGLTPCVHAAAERVVREIAEYLDIATSGSASGSAEGVAR